MGFSRLDGHRSPAIPDQQIILKQHRDSMKTKFLFEKGRISLLVDHGKNTDAEKQVLAAMTLSEGTRCWTIIDIRLNKVPVAHPWSGSEMADDFNAHWKPKSPSEAEAVKAMLLEYEEREDGTLMWCTYRNIVRGDLGVKGYTPVSSRGLKLYTHHDKASGMAKLREMKAFWECHHGTIAEAAIHNPYSQPSSSDVWLTLTCEELLARHGL
jgi:hypothetical protein